MRSVKFCHKFFSQFIHGISNSFTHSKMRSPIVHIGWDYLPNLERSGFSGTLCRVLDLRSRGCGFEPHQRYCVVPLSKTYLSLLSTGSTQEDPSRQQKITTIATVFTRTGRSICPFLVHKMQDYPTAWMKVQNFKIRTFEILIYKLAGCLQKWII